MNFREETTIEFFRKDEASALLWDYLYTVRFYEDFLPDFDIEIISASLIDSNPCSMKENSSVLKLVTGDNENAVSFSMEQRLK